MIDGVDNLKTTLDDDASLYKGADKRSQKEKWKDLTGPEKWQYFKDYLLSKVLGGLAGVGLLIWFIVSVFGPKKEEILNVAVVSNPLTPEVLESITTGLSDLIVADPDKETVLFDTGYVLSSDEYATRMKIMTLIAANQMDCMIIPKSELQNHVDGNVVLDLFMSDIPKSTLAELEPYLVYVTPEEKDIDGSHLSYGVESAYAFDITSCFEELSGFQFRTPYYLVVIANAPHPDNVTALVCYLFGIDQDNN